MERRRFLTMLGAAAAGGTGLVTGRNLLIKPEPPSLGAVLADAAGPPMGERAGTRRVIWSVDTDEPAVALTFDDGPDPELTPRVLDILAEYGVLATFNVMGYNAVRFPDLISEAVKAGHEIGNHTWTHLDLSNRSPDEIESELRLGQEAIESIAGVRPRFFRPPRGQMNGTTVRYAARMGYDIVLWSVGRGAPTGSPPEAVAAHVIGELHPGDIVGLHDGIGRETFNTDIKGVGPIRLRREVEVAALRSIIEGSLDRGFRFETLSALLESPPAERA